MRTISRIITTPPPAATPMISPSSAIHKVANRSSDDSLQAGFAGAGEGGKSKAGLGSGQHMDHAVSGATPIFSTKQTVAKETGASRAKKAISSRTHISNAQIRKLVAVLACDDCCRACIGATLLSDFKRDVMLALSNLVRLNHTLVAATPHAFAAAGAFCH